MRIFITGISGVLGSVLAKELRGRGHEVFGCDLQHSSDPNVVRADVADARQLSNAFRAFDDYKDYDLVYHLAAEFGRKNGQEFYEDLWRTNCIGTRNVIEECISEHNNYPLIFASSSEAYGLSELYNGGDSLREEMLDTYPPQFHSEYALSKYTNERQIFTAVRNDGLKAIVLRFFNVYGPPERYSPYRSVVCQFAWKMLNNMPLIVNREGRRSHLWIGDWAYTVADIAYTHTLDRLFTPAYRVWPGAGGTAGVPVFNIGGTEYESIEALYERLRELIPESTSTVVYQDSEPANSATKQPNNLMAETWFNHTSLMSLQAGLEKTVADLRKIRDAQ